MECGGRNPALALTAKSQSGVMAAALQKDPIANSSATFDNK
jgi:hypothetical protein